MKFIKEWVTINVNGIANEHNSNTALKLYC